MNDKEYIPGDIDHNVKVALQVMKEIYWGGNREHGDSMRFNEAQEIIIIALLYGRFDLVRKEE